MSTRIQSISITQTDAKLHHRIFQPSMSRPVPIEVVPGCNDQRSNMFKFWLEGRETNGVCWNTAIHLLAAVWDRRSSNMFKQFSVEARHRLQKRSRFSGPRNNQNQKPEARVISFSDLTSNYLCISLLEIRPKFWAVTQLKQLKWCSFFIAMVSTCLNHRFTHYHFPSHLRTGATLEALPVVAPSQQQVVGEAQRLLLVELEMFRLWQATFEMADQYVSNISNHWQFSPAPCNNPRVWQFGIQHTFSGSDVR